MSSLLVFNRVCRLEIQSVMLVFFSTPSCELAPLYLLSSSVHLPPPPCVNEYRSIRSIQCVTGAGGRDRVEWRAYTVQELHGTATKRSITQSLCHLKVPKCEIFDLFDFNDFYVIKSL
jgi:hypothetical protein